MRKKSTGTLVNDALLPGKRVYMFPTGTGIAPFASLIRDPDTYDKYDEVILTHTCREVSEPTYAQELIAAIKDDPFVGELTNGRLRLYVTVTREEFTHTGRIAGLIANGMLFSDMGVPPNSSQTDRGMISGFLEMLRDTKANLEGFGLVEGANSKPATFVVERAFVD